MKAKLSCLFLVLLAVVFASYQPFSGDKWQKLSAEEKQEKIWTEVTRDKTPGSFPSAFSALNLFVESMATSFDSASDDFPAQGMFGYVRSKLIHSVGVIAKIRWRSFGAHPYTGLFNGAKYGFVRFSWASAPDFSSPFPYVPGVAFKFLRSGIKSANFMAMTSLSGVESANFFLNDVTNHVPNLSNNNATLKLKVLKYVFSKASSWPVFLGLSDFALYDQVGQKAEDVRFPYRLIFHAPPEVRALLRTNETISDLPAFFTSRISQALPLLYHVYAEDEPNSKPFKIGEIEMASPPLSSSFSDRTLFFQHQRMEEDLNLRPEWVYAAQDQLDLQGRADRFLYPNLSD